MSVQDTMSQAARPVIAMTVRGDGSKVRRVMANTDIAFWLGFASGVVTTLALTAAVLGITLIIIRLRGDDD